MALLWEKTAIPFHADAEIHFVRDGTDQALALMHNAGQEGCFLCPIDWPARIG